MKLQSVFIGVILSSTLVACGGSGGSSNPTKESGNSGAESQPNTADTPSATTEAVKVTSSVGQAARIGSSGKLDTALLNNKTYYARYAYCVDTSCSSVRNGLMHFETTVTNGNISLKNLVVDAVGKSTPDAEEVPQFSAERTGSVSLASSSLTERNANNRLFNLKATSANSTENKLPSNIDIAILLSKDGKNMMGADEDYIFVAQQMSSKPANWTVKANKSQAVGSWQSTTVNNAARISSKGQVSIKNSANNSFINSKGAADFSFNNGERTIYGLYKASGYGYAFGYTENGKVADGRNFDGVSGAIMLSPDGKFGVGYDASTGGGAFLLTK